MANPLRNYMHNVLGIPEIAVDEIIGEAGFRTFDDLAKIPDERIVSTIKNCRKHRVEVEEEQPRRTDPRRRGRRAGKRAARRARNRRSRDDSSGSESSGSDSFSTADGEDKSSSSSSTEVRIRKVRIKISDLAEHRMRQLAYFCFHMNKIDREVIPAEATLDRLHKLWVWRTRMLEHVKREFTPPELMLKDVTTRKTLEELDHYLLNKCGVTGTPLAYLTRAYAVPIEEDDPGFGEPTITDELIRRARHGTYEDYDDDNKFLWEIIHDMTKGGFAWAWVSNQQRHRNGRQAYIQLKSHFLGPSYQEKIKSDSERILETAYYDGKSRNFSLEDYCGTIKRAWTDIEEMGEEVSQARKLRIFLKGFRCPELESAKRQIQATPDLKKDIDAAMNYAKTIENEMNSYKPQSNRNVSSVESKGKSKGGGKKGGKDKKQKGSKDKKDKKKPRTDYIPYSKWKDLSPTERQAVRDARDAAGIPSKRTAAAVATEDDSSKKPAETTNTGVGATMSRKGS
jgi:hypothetical protein